MDVKKHINSDGYDFSRHIQVLLTSEIISVLILNMYSKKLPSFKVYMRENPKESFIFQEDLFSFAFNLDSIVKFRRNEVKNNKSIRNCYPNKSINCKILKFHELHTFLSPILIFPSSDNIFYRFMEV